MSCGVHLPLPINKMKMYTIHHMKHQAENIWCLLHACRYARKQVRTLLCPEKLWRSKLAGEAETSSQNSNLSLVHFLSVLQITPGTGGIGSGLLLHKKICRHPHTIWLSVHVIQIEFQACNPLACLAKINLCRKINSFGS